MAKKQFHVRMEPLIEAFAEHIKGMSSDELARIAGEIFGYEPSLKMVGDDTIFTFSTSDLDDEDFDALKNCTFAKVATESMPGERKSRIQRLFEAAEAGGIPADSAAWGSRGPAGWTVAHQAALFGRLPQGFNQWHLVDEDGDTVAHEAARTGQLPADFDGWDWANDDGFAVAHMAAIHGHLPPNFSEWELLDTFSPMEVGGKTVAQYAAEAGHLPADFDRWDLVSEDYRPEGWEARPATPKVGM
jgi:hypothetical protein